MNGFLSAIDRHRAAATWICCATLLVAVVFNIGRLGWFAASPGVSPRVAQAYFYDLNTGELFSAPAEHYGPIETSSGSFEGRPAGVRAIVLSCGSCLQETERFVGWLEMPEPESSSRDRNANMESRRTLIRDPAGTQWHASESSQASKIIKAAYQRCGNGPVRFCHPRSVSL